MKRKTGKTVRRLLGLMLCAGLFCTVPYPREALADAAVEGFWETAYEVDYYVEVSAPDGGVNYRYGAGVEYDKVFEHMIPNGTILHIEMEARADNGKMWGQTEYQDYWGWVALSQTKRVNPGNISPAPAVQETVPQQQPYGIGKVTEPDTETEPYSWEVPETEPRTGPEPDISDGVTGGGTFDAILKALAAYLQMKMFLP